MITTTCNEPLEVLYNHENITDILQFLNYVSNIDYFKTITTNITLYDEYLYNIQFKIQTIYDDENEYHIINIGFGTGGFYIDHYEVNNKQIIFELLKNSCLH